MAAESITLIFDGSCGFCTLSVDVLRALDWRHSIHAVPFQRSGIPEAAGLTRRQCQYAVWLTTPAGKRYSSAGAASRALDQLVVAPIFSLLYAIPGLHQLEDAVYRWVAAHRGLLPGIRPRYGQPGGHCALPGRRDEQSE